MPLGDGRRVAFVNGSADALLTGPGLRAGGCRLADLPDWGAWRRIWFTSATAIWLGRLAGPDAGEFVQNLDLAIAACEATTDRPEGERFVWNVEIAALVEDWLAARKPADHKALAKLVAAGRIDMGAFTANLVQAPCDPEELMRICDRALRLGKQLRGKIASAHQIDCPGLHPRLAAAMNTAGVRYLTWGANSQMSRRTARGPPCCSQTTKAEKPSGSWRRN